MGRMRTDSSYGKPAKLSREERLERDVERLTRMSDARQRAAIRSMDLCAALAKRVRALEAIKSAAMDVRFHIQEIDDDAMRRSVFHFDEVLAHD